MNPKPSPSDGVHPITEDDIADFLIHTPDFFERHAELLAGVQLGSPHGGRAISLQERQAEMLREKIKAFEHRVMDMIRHGNENMAIADRLHRWTRALLLTPDAAGLPATLVTQSMEQFQIPQAAIKVWGVAAEHAEAGFALGASHDAISFASSLAAPFCGPNAGFEAVQWLDDPAEARSVALVALRAGRDEPAFGLLVLASPDPQRFHADMGTEFLERMAELASAALSRLRPQ